MILNNSNTIEKSDEYEFFKFGLEYGEGEFKYSILTAPGNFKLIIKLNFYFEVLRLFYRKILATKTICFIHRVNIFKTLYEDIIHSYCRLFITKHKN